MRPGFFLGGLTLSQGLLTWERLGHWGIALGSRHFLKAPPESFRRFTLALLIVLAPLDLPRRLVLYTKEQWCNTSRT